MHVKTCLLGTSLSRTYLRLRQGEEEQEDGSDLPVEGYPA